MPKSLKSIRAFISAPEVGLDVLRIYLGVALVVRGSLFIADPTRVVSFMEQSRSDWLMPIMIAHYVAFAHLGGGILLTVGLVTRLAAAVQVPALVGAVFYIHLGEGLLTSSQSLELSGLVLMMLAVFTVFGAGPLSADRLVFGNPKGKSTDESEPRTPERHDGSRSGRPILGS